MHKITKRLSLLLFPLMGLALLLSGCATQLKAYNAHEKLGPQINYTITGIDAGAGIMGNSQTALSVYGLKSANWQLQTSSTAAMTSALNKAIQYKQPIVITGWQPHWMFTKYKLKFLKDPKNVYGKTENIHTITRVGFKQSNPAVYKFLQNFNWTPSQMSEIMLKVNNGMDPAKAAQQYIDKNPAQVKQWLKGVAKGKGQKVTIAYVAWDSEIASTNLVKRILDKQGYKVTIQAMEAQPMWAAIATKAADISLSAWLPNTHAVYAKQYKGQYTDVRANLHGAKTGLAVPTYMKNINSIEDLKSK